MYADSDLRRNYYKAAYLRSLPRPAPVVIIDTPPLFDLFVDGVNGDDDNSGERISEPIKTIAKLLTKLIGPGIRVGLARDSHFRENLTFTQSNLTFGAYGSGANPLLDGSDVIDPSTWTKTIGRTYVYETQIAFQTPGANTWIRVWGDGVSMVRATSIANCDATPNSYYPSSDVVSPATLYVNGNGKLYEYNARLVGLECYSATGTVIDSIDTRRGNNNNGSMVLGRSTTLSNSVVSDGTKHNLFAREGCALSYVTMSNAYYAGGGTSMFVLADTLPVGLSVSCINCTCQNSTYDNTVAGFFWEVIGGGAYASVNLTNCNGANVSTLFSGSGTPIVNIATSIGTGLGVGLRMDAAATYTLSNINWSGSSSIVIGFNIAGATLFVDTATLTSSHASPTIIYSILNNQTARLTNVNMIGNANTIGYYNTGANQNLYARGCTVPHPANYAWAALTATDILYSDYNAYHTGINFRYGGAWMNLAAWQAATGQDAHSTVSG